MNVVLVILVIRYSTLAWSWVEYLCLALACLGLSIWLVWGNTSLGMTCSLIAMCIGTFPMVKDAWNAPHEFSLLGWMFWVLSSALALVAVDAWEYSHYAQPLYFLVMCLIVWILLLIRPLWLPPRRTDPRLHSSE